MQSLSHWVVEQQAQVDVPMSVVSFSMAKGRYNRGIKYFNLFICFSNAEISVVLCNQGLEAIDIERFGRSITIIRRISIQGGSRYLIKNEYGSFDKLDFSF